MGRTFLSARFFVITSEHSERGICISVLRITPQCADKLDLHPSFSISKCYIVLRLELFMPDKGRFPHYMIKEIFEQPQAVRDTIADNLSSKTRRVELAVTRRIPRDASVTFKKITIAASGTSRHAGIAGRHMIQELAGIPVDVEYASEFEYGNPITGPEELTIVITQSGETADTLRRAAARAIARIPHPGYHQCSGFHHRARSRRRHPYASRT